jgi:hypothetical protein
VRTHVVALIAAMGFLAVSAACGGGDDDAGSGASKLPSTALVGTWVDGTFVVAFTPEGHFSIDNDGSLDDGNFASGTYTVEGSKIRFLAVEGARGCGGQKWDFETSLSESGTLDAELLQEACQTTAGTRWSLVKR